MDFNKLLDFSVTPYHTVDFIRREFAQAGFSTVDMDSSCLGMNLMAERGGALVAVRMPKRISRTSRFRLALAHTDFPALKVCPNPDKECAGVAKLHTEVYGGALFTSWLDRDLGYAGLLAVEKDGILESRLVRGEALLRIPQLAIHLNRGVNQEGLKVNPQVDFDALWSASVVDDESAPVKFVDALGRGLESGERVVDFDVQLFDAQPAATGGFNGEWLYSGRLDNLSSCHAIAEAMLRVEPSENDFVVAAFLNNEEVGSTTREGAAGNFLKTVLETVWARAWRADSAATVSPGATAAYAAAVAPDAANFVPSVSATPAAAVAPSLSLCLSESLALSIDMAHAEHPNHPEKHESNHAPLLGRGIVLKTNSQKRYASDVMSSARFRLLCEQANVPYQVFVSRSDIPCGSTVGPTVSASLGIPTVDIGEPMLSMHSIREMMAWKDHESMISLVREFFS